MAIENELLRRDNYFLTLEKRDTLSREAALAYSSVGVDSHLESITSALEDQISELARIAPLSPPNFPEGNANLVSKKEHQAHVSRAPIKRQSIQKPQMFQLPNSGPLPKCLLNPLW